MLGNCSLAELRRRRSFKWRTYPDDVLPAFVAEMDFDLAEPIGEAIRAAVAISDTGYGHKGELGEAFAAFARGRLRWSPDPARIFAIPDVMTGIAEMIMAVTPPGSGIVINPPVYAPFFFRIGFTGRHVVERRCGGIPMAVTTWTSRRSIGRSAMTASARTCSAARTIRSAGSGPASS